MFLYSQLCLWQYLPICFLHANSEVDFLETLLLSLPIPSPHYFYLLPYQTSASSDQVNSETSNKQGAMANHCLPTQPADGSPWQSDSFNVCWERFLTKSKLASNIWHAGSHSYKGKVSWKVSWESILCCLPTHDFQAYILTLLTSTQEVSGKVIC